MPMSVGLMEALVDWERAIRAEDDAVRQLLPRDIGGGDLPMSPDASKHLHELHDAAEAAYAKYRQLEDAEGS
jgi:hypothetical protein